MHTPTRLTFWVKATRRVTRNWFAPYPCHINQPFVTSHSEGECLAKINSSKVGKKEPRRAPFKFGRRSLASGCTWGRFSSYCHVIRLAYAFNNQAVRDDREWRRCMKAGMVLWLEGGLCFDGWILHWSHESDSFNLNTKHNGGVLALSFMLRFGDDWVCALRLCLCVSIVACYLTLTCRGTWIACNAY